MLNHRGKALFLPYFCGDSWVKSGFIQTHMGYGGYGIEKNLLSTCQKNPQIASWFIFNCSRAEKITEAGIAGGSEWSDEEESVAQSMNATILVTYACGEGEPLKENRDFTSDLLMYLRSNMREGKINLNKALLNIPDSIGHFTPFCALRTVTLKSTKFFQEQFANLADFRQLQDDLQ